jgi:hypothetical protein
MVLDGGRIAALFRTSDFERAELTERIDRLLAGPPGGKEAPA